MYLQIILKMQVCFACLKIKVLRVCVCVCTRARTCAHALSRFIHVRLCDPMGCNLPGSSVHGILQARILEWVTVPSSRGSFQLSDQTRVSYVSCTGRQALLPLVPPGKPQGTMYFSSKGHLDTKSYSYDRTAS